MRGSSLGRAVVFCVGRKLGSARIVLMGDCGGEDAEDDAVSELWLLRLMDIPVSLDLDFPLRKTPGGGLILRNRTSSSIVGRFSSSSYEKYAVRCHFRARVFGPSCTLAEYACFTNPLG